MNEPETNEPTTGSEEPTTSDPPARSPGHLSPDQRAAQRRQLLRGIQAARHGASKSSGETPAAGTTLVVMESLVQLQNDQADSIAETGALVRRTSSNPPGATEQDATAADPTSPNGTSQALRRIEMLVRQQEALTTAIADSAKQSHERLLRLEVMTPLYEDLAGELTERLNRSSRQIEDTVLALRRTEYLLGQVDERCQKGHELLSRVEMLILNADGMLTASRRELQSEATATRRYIAQKLRFAPLLLLVTTLLLTVTAFAWWSQRQTTAGQAPIAETR
jgi:hypothetical protein